MLELLVKITALLGLALGISVCLPKSRPTQRHFVLLCSVLALPLVCLVQYLPPLVSVPVPVAVPTVLARTPLALKAPRIVAKEGALSRTERIVPPTQAPVSLPDESPRVSNIRVLLGIYLLGVLGFLVRLLRDRLALHRLLTTAQNAALPSPFPVFFTTTPTVPLACGVGRPRILLPRSALAWAPERLQAVLLHESAHLRRRDPLWQGYAAVLCALLWPHPLVWWVAKRLAAEAEDACDAAVLEAGITPSHYAEHLLAIATQTRKAPLLAPSLGQPGKLERRIRNILAFVPAHTLPLMSVFFLVALALVCLPLVFVKLYRLPDTSKLMALEIVQRMEHAYATCATYTDSGESLRPYNTDPGGGSFQTTFTRDGYVHATFQPTKTGPTYQLIIDGDRYLTTSGGRVYQWRSREIALEAYPGNNARKIRSLFEPGRDSYRNAKGGLERMPDHQGKLVLRAYWFTAEQMKKYNSRGLYSELTVDPETFLVLRERLIEESKVYSDVRYQPKSPLWVRRWVPADPFTPGLTPAQERKLALLRQSVLPLQAEEQRLKREEENARAEEKALCTDIAFAQGQIVYFTQKTIGLQERIEACQWVEQESERESWRTKHILVQEEAQKNLRKWEQRKQTAVQKLQQQ